MSLIPVGFCNLKPGEFDLDSLKRLVKWFKSAFMFCIDLDAQDFGFDWVFNYLISYLFHLLDHSKWNFIQESCLIDKFGNKIVHSRKEMALLFVSMIRSLGLDARFVMSAQPISLKLELSNEEVIVSQKKKPDTKKKNCVNGNSKKVKQSKKVHYFSLFTFLLVFVSLFECSLRFLGRSFFGFNRKMDL